MITADANQIRPLSCQTALVTNDVNERHRPAWHGGYLRMLPAICRQARFRVRHLARNARADAVQEIIADTVVTYARLAERNKEGSAYPTPMVKFAMAKFRAGRLVGNRLNSKDVTSEYCQRRRRIEIERLDQFSERSGNWEGIVVEDRHATPADVAATRIDFREWLNSLPERTRQIAQMLATGESTSDVAHAFAVSPGRISQLRVSLRERWNSFIMGSMKTEA